MSSRWVPKYVAPLNQKEKRVSCLNDFLGCDRDQANNFLDSIVTMDRTYRITMNLRQKQHSMASIAPPKKFKRKKSMGKIMARMLLG